MLQIVGKSAGQEIDRRQFRRHALRIKEIHKIGHIRKKKKKEFFVSRNHAVEVIVASDFQAGKTERRSLFRKSIEIAERAVEPAVEITHGRKGARARDRNFEIVGVNRGAHEKSLGDAIGRLTREERLLFRFACQPRERAYCNSRPQRMPEDRRIRKIDGGIAQELDKVDRATIVRVFARVRPRRIGLPMKDVELRVRKDGR